MLGALVLVAGLLLSWAAAASTFPEMEIAKRDTAHEWPFSVERGTLVCVAMQGQRTVLFSEP